MQKYLHITSTINSYVRDYIQYVQKLYIAVQTLHRVSVKTTIFVT